MKIEFLGAGGAIPVPRPFCFCAVCEEARQKGAPYTRYCPSLFIHDIGLLIDTPEEIAVQLNRARIKQVNAVTYSHWHPDHTAGIRVWESNYDPNQIVDPSFPRHTTDIYLAENVAKTFEQNHDLAGKCAYLERYQLVKTQIVPAGESFALDSVTIKPIVLAESIACGFLIEGQAKRVLICMDETYGWMPPAGLGCLDLAIVPAGLFEFHPLTGERLIAADHPLLKREITYAQTLEVVRLLNAQRVIFSHLNKFDYLTFHQYQETARRHNAAPSNGLPPIEFAYDTLIVEV
jgi:phosphoribosyl 1,2-cyclic phosphate phosphodiesterase